jgi:hypothetical protein
VAGMASGDQETAVREKNGGSAEGVETGQGRRPKITRLRIPNTHLAQPVPEHHLTVGQEGHVNCHDLPGQHRPPVPRDGRPLVVDYGHR